MADVRAMRLNESTRMLTLCDDERCLQSASYWLVLHNGTEPRLCTRHAKTALLDAALGKLG